MPTISQLVRNGRKPKIRKVKAPAMRKIWNSLDQRQTFAAPMADTGDHGLAQRAGHGLFHAGTVGRRKQLSVTDGDGGERHIHRELRLQPMT